MNKNSGPGMFKLGRIVSWLLIIAAILIFLIYFQAFLQPFVLAVVFWYFIRELRILLGKIKFRGKKLSHLIRGIIALIIMLVLIASVIDLLTTNIEEIINKLPKYSEIRDRYIDDLGENLGMPDMAAKIEGKLKQIDVGDFLTGILDSLTSTIGDVVMIIIYIIFLLIEEAIFVKKIQLIAVSNKQFHNIQSLLDQINHSINRYVVMKTLVSLSTGLMSYIILLLLGVDYAVFWAFLIFILNYIPYVGSLIATLLPAFFSIFQFDSGWYFLYVLIAVEAVQIFNGNFLEPRIMGRSLNLSPLVVVLSLTIWSSIWGVVGMLLSVPIMSVLTIIMAQFPRTRNISIMLSETGNIDSMLVKFVKKDENS